MNLLDIQDEYLRFQIKFASKKFEHDEINEKDLSTIEMVTIDAKSKDSYFNDLLLFKNLKYCTIKNYTIDKEKVIILNSLSHLNNIDFDTCIFENFNLSINISAQNLEFSFCKNVNLYNFINMSELKNLRIMFCNKIDLKNICKLEKLEKIYFESVNIKNFKYLEKLKNLNYLNLCEVEFKNKQLLNNLKKKNVVIEEVTPNELLIK